jgi:hypothetical protein
MTRPDEPADDRTMPSAADPWTNADGPAPTVNLGSPTAYLGDPNQTVHLGPGNPDQTAYLGPADPNQTVHLGPADPNQTVHLGPADLNQTVRLGPAGPARTAHLGPGNPTVRRSEPTVWPADSTSHVRPTAPAFPAGDSEPTMRAQQELRFGPGVPAAPVATPAWPAAAGTAAPRRPLWRRLVSLASSLLTLVLIGVVGLYIWQRLSPLELEGVSVAVPQPAGNRCDVTVDVVATVRTNGKGGVIRYQWFRSDASPGAVLTEQVGSGQRTAALTLAWTFSGVGTATETATVNIIEPSPIQAGTPVEYRCRG